MRLHYSAHSQLGPFGRKAGSRKLLCGPPDGQTRFLASLFSELMWGNLKSTTWSSHVCRITGRSLMTLVKCWCNWQRKKFEAIKGSIGSTNELFGATWRRVAHLPPV